MSWKEYKGKNACRCSSFSDNANQAQMENWLVTSQTPFPTLPTSQPASEKEKNQQKIEERKPNF
jgi:hypothetical protein